MKYFVFLCFLGLIFSARAEDVVSKEPIQAPTEENVQTKTVETVPEQTEEKDEKLLSPADVFKTDEPKSMNPEDKNRIGSKEAPVKIYLFSSLTCSHCAVAMKTVLPDLKKAYLDEGLAELIYIDAPFDKRSLAGSLVAHCVKPEHFFSFLNTLYEHQDEWAFQKNSKEVLLRFASQEGLSKEDVEQCLHHQKNLKKIITERDEMLKKYDLRSTPTFILRRGKEMRMVLGAQKNSLFKKINVLLRD